MKREEIIASIGDAVKEKIQTYLSQQPMADVASLDWIQQLAQTLSKQLSKCVFEAWKEVLEKVAQEIGRSCPQCGRPRKCKWRSGEPMRLDVLGFCFELPKLYLECGYCGAPGISIMKVLTGLRAGEASLELKMAAGYCAAQHSYGKASRDLKTHYGQEVERTKVRRMALEVEGRAIEFAESRRRKSLERVSAEAKTIGPTALILQGDGGKVRTGRLRQCEPGDGSYGKRTAKRGKPCRKRPTSYREMITLDVREPGEINASALDTLVPVQAPEGERSRRMLALAARQGLGDNTRVVGLGDMGSGLAASFEEAFVGYECFWSADWKHTRDYVEAASKVLEGLDGDEWARQMKQAIWGRDEKQRDELLEQALRHRVNDLPSEYDKCPVTALSTYLKNNWKHMEFSRQEREGLPIVSARAEAQVRDRTKDRFSVAGAWRVENLEPKAVLRSIIAEGSWEGFRAAQIRNSKTVFERELLERLEKAIDEGRLSRDRVDEAFGQEVPKARREKAAA